jgi:Uma2 family endonuclease
MAVVLEKPSPDLAEEIPPLENGDNLDADEFMRRYKAMPVPCKAELIDGVVYMASPVSYRKHGRPHTLIGGWLFLYEIATRGVEGGDNSTTRIDLGSNPQPDLLLRIPEEAGGTSRIDEDDYVEGPPELIVEVAASTASVDLNQKYATYARHGVQEYVVWRTRDRVIDWFVRNDAGEYEAMPVGKDKLLRSRVFPGLWLDAAALLRGDLPAVRATVEAGCATAEHAAFVERLAAAVTK